MTPEVRDRWYCSPYVQSIAYQLQEVIPHSHAEQIRQVAQNEGTVLSRIKGLMLLVTLAALLASALAVSAAMATSVFERRGEVGLMKALGAGSFAVSAIFFAEALLLALVGGKPEVVARARPVFGTFASDIMHLGDVGHGQVGKTMNNMLLWVNAIGLLEAGRLAETTGIDLVKLREALMMSSGASDALKEWDMISFTWALKDMQIVTDMTDKAGLSLPITGAIKELVKDARRVKASNPPNWTGNKPVKYG